MYFGLSEDQEFFQENIKKFLDDNASVDVIRKIATYHPEHQKDIQEGLVSLGINSLLVPEEYGGSNFGVAGISSILEELGRTLTPSPLFSTAVVGVSLIKHAKEEIKKEILSKVVQEGLRLCFAIEESNHHDPLKISCKAEKDGDNFKISG